MEDKRKIPAVTPSSIASEGALWKGHALSEYGEPDAYGHSKKSDIGLALGVEIQKRLTEETMITDLTYELRSGEPDALDQIVSTTMGNVAVDLIRDGARTVGGDTGRKVCDCAAARSEARSAKAGCWRIVQCETLPAALFGTVGFADDAGALAGEH